MSKAETAVQPKDIRFDGISKGYGNMPVLRDFSTTLPAGRTTALMGPSGSGKTTLSRILLGLEAPDTGSVVGGGSSQQFACVFQEDRLCEEFSATENVALVLPREAAADVPANLAAVGLSGEDIIKPVAALSGGERRRVALVRAVMAHSRVLVLDEAFKGLDAATREATFAYIRENLRGRTLVLITHDPAEAEAFGAAVVPVEKLA